MPICLAQPFDLISSKVSMAACISSDFNPVGSCKKSTSIQDIFNDSKLSETLLINPAGEKS